MTVDDRDFLRLVSFVRDRYGINLENKRALVDARLGFYISKRGYSDFARYLSKVFGNPEGEESRLMINRLSTNYTFFFRESDYIGQLGSVLQKVFLPAGRLRLRVWCAACSSGQEAYSAAMVLENERRRHSSVFDYEIIGTDINTEMLEYAARGEYPAQELENIPAHYRCYTTPRADGGFGIVDEIKKKICWKYKNLLDTAPESGRCDIVFCRNVMIYFTPELRRDMTRLLHASLAPGGYLFTGTTESIDLERRYFRYIAPAFYQSI